MSERYNRLAKETGRSRSYYVNEALAAEIDRLEYEYGLMKKVEDFRAGRLETVTLDELEESLGWRIEIDKDVQRSMRKLDRQIAKRIVAKLREISQLEDPRSMGKGLTENKSGLWRYRVGDYRSLSISRTMFSSFSLSMSTIEAGSTGREGNKKAPAHWAAFSN